MLINIHYKECLNSIPNVYDYQKHNLKVLRLLLRENRHTHTHTPRSFRRTHNTLFHKPSLSYTHTQINTHTLFLSLSYTLF